MRLLIVVFIISVLGTVSFVQSTEGGNHAALLVSDLQRTQTCSRDTSCQFAAQVQLKGDNFLNMKNTDPDFIHGIDELGVDFHILSEGGDAANNFYRLEVTDATGGNTEAVSSLVKNPVFFTQSLENGLIGGIMVSKDEAINARTLKRSLIRSLAQPIHPEALKRDDFAYSFVDADQSGPILVHHDIRRQQTGDERDRIVLMETKNHFARQDDPNIAVSHDAMLTLTPTGQISTLQERGSISLQGKLDSFGSYNLNAKSNIERMKQVPRSTSITNIHDFGQLANAELNGAETIPFADAINQDVYMSGKETADLIDKATFLVDSGMPVNAQFLDNLAGIMNRDTVGDILDHTISSAMENKIEGSRACAVIGAAGAIREPETVSALSKIVTASNLPTELREAACFALLPEEKSEESIDMESLQDLPSFVQSAIQTTSEEGMSPLASTATMLLGALSSHMDADSARQITDMMEMELNNTPLNSEIGSQKAATLLYALGNSKMASAASGISKFASSEVENPLIRAAALRAMRYFADDGDVDASVSIMATSDDDVLLQLQAQMFGAEHSLQTPNVTVTDAMIPLVNKTLSLSSIKKMLTVSTSANMGVKKGSSSFVGSARLNANVLGARANIANGQYTTRFRDKSGASGSLLISLFNSDMSTLHSSIPHNQLPSTTTCDFTQLPAAADVALSSKNIFKVLQYSRVIPMAVGVQLRCKISMNTVMSLGLIMNSHKTCADGDAVVTNLAGVLNRGSIGVSIKGAVDTPLSKAMLSGNAVIMDGDVYSFVTETNGTRACAVVSTDSKPLNASMVAAHSKKGEKTIGKKLGASGVEAERNVKYIRCIQDLGGKTVKTCGVDDAKGRLVFNGTDVACVVSGKNNTKMEEEEADIEFAPAVQVPVSQLEQNLVRQWQEQGLKLVGAAQNAWQTAERADVKSAAALKEIKDSLKAGEDAVKTYQEYDKLGKFALTKMKNAWSHMQNDGEKEREMFKKNQDIQKTILETKKDGADLRQQAEDEYGKMDETTQKVLQLGKEAKKDKKVIRQDARIVAKEAAEAVHNMANEQLEAGSNHE